MKISRKAAAQQNVIFSVTLYCIHVEKVTTVCRVLRMCPWYTPFQLFRSSNFSLTGSAPNDVGY